MLQSYNSSFLNDVSRTHLVFDEREPEAWYVLFTD